MVCLFKKKLTDRSTQLSSGNEGDNMLFLLDEASVDRDRCMEDEL